jgi:hypothetical protein
MGFNKGAYNTFYNFLSNRCGSARLTNILFLKSHLIEQKLDLTSNAISIDDIE